MSTPKKTKKAAISVRLKLSILIYVTITCVGKKTTSVGELPRFDWVRPIDRACPHHTAPRKLSQAALPPALSRLFQFRYLPRKCRTSGGGSVWDRGTPRVRRILRVPEWSRARRRKRREPAVTPSVTKEWWVERALCCHLFTHCQNLIHAISIYFKLMLESFTLERNFSQFFKLITHKRTKEIYNGLTREHLEDNLSRPKSLCCHGTWSGFPWPMVGLCRELARPRKLQLQCNPQIPTAQLCTGPGMFFKVTEQFPWIWAVKK